jgi:2-isopropylmalate synthase
MDPKDYLHDWNAASGDAPTFNKRVEIDDETLRDGLQSPSVTHPSVEMKRKCLRYMVGLGIQRADIGLPMSAQLHDIRALLTTIAEERLAIQPGLAVRTVIADFETVARLRDEFPTLPIKANAFLAMSRLRMWAEEWEWSQVLDRAISSVAWAKRHGIPVMFVTEDTTRSRPEDVRALYTLAVKEGASEVCVADTVGDALPWGAKSIVKFVRGALDEAGYQGVRINWHGHSDRGMGLVNCFGAIEGGADVVHGTIMGIGERSGNAQLDMLLVNLKLLGLWEPPLDKLREYVEVVSASTGIGVPLNYPVFGTDAFRTATGVHAAAIVKAKRRGELDVADLVYSSVPASMVGRTQRIDVGPLSGKWCASAWLEANGYRADDEERIARILEIARRSGRTLQSEELHAIAAGRF